METLNKSDVHFPATGGGGGEGGGGVGGKGGGGGMRNVLRLVSRRLGAEVLLARDIHGEAHEGHSKSLTKNKGRGEHFEVKTVFPKAIRVLRQTARIRPGQLQAEGAPARGVRADLVLYTVFTVA